MAGSADVQPEQPKPDIMHANIRHSVVGLAGQLVVAYTHSGLEGVVEAVQADLEQALKEVFARHGFTL